MGRDLTSLEVHRVFALQGGGGGCNLGRVQGTLLAFTPIAQLEVTANTALPAITPTDSWVICGTTTVTDTHHFRHGQCGTS